MFVSESAGHRARPFWGRMGRTSEPALMSVLMLLRPKRVSDNDRMTSDRVWMSRAKTRTDKCTDLVDCNNPFLLTTFKRCCSSDAAVVLRFAHASLWSLTPLAGPLLQESTFLLLRHRAKDLSEMSPQCVIKCLPTILRDKHHMILAVPRRMA